MIWNIIEQFQKTMRYIALEALMMIKGNVYSSARDVLQVAKPFIMTGPVKLIGEHNEVL